MRHPADLAMAAAAAAAIVVGVVPAAGSASNVAAAAATATPACSALPTPTAYHPGARVLSPQPGGAPRPCGVSTGFAAAESHIVTTPGGTIVYTPAVTPSGALGTGEAGVAADPQAAPLDAADADAAGGAGNNTQGNATPAGLALSTDQGVHWTLTKPDGVTWNPTDHGDYVDPRTGRFFFEDYGPIPLAPAFGANQEGPAHVMWTDDFHTWHHTVVSNLVLPENPRFTSAAPPPGQPAPVGYPSVVYFCANTNVGFTSPAIQGRLCYRSLDGGSTWTERSELLNADVPEHPECGGNGESFSAVDGYYPGPTTDGDLYTLVACGGRTFLARSTDEAASFPVVHTARGPVSLDLPVDSITALGSGPQLRIDSANDFYVVYPVVSASHIVKLVLIVSSDRGVTWSSPADVTPPGMSEIIRWAMAVGSPGRLALAIIGHQTGQTTYDAYLVSTADALAAADQPSAPGPLLWSARATSQPLLFADHIVGAGYIVGVGEIAVPYPFPLGIQPLAGPLVAGNDFIGATVGPDGTAWGSFDQDCGPGPTATGCVADHDQTRGFVASLTAPATSSATPAPAPGAGASGPVAPADTLPATGAPPLVPPVGLAVAVLALITLAWRRRSA